MVSEQDREGELVVRVQRGDLAAFERLLELHSAHLRAFVAMKLPVPHLIDEIAHEAFVFAHRHIHDFKPGTDFGKWLRAIAFNLVRKETLRHQRLTRNREKFLEHHLAQEALKSGHSPDLPAVAEEDFEGRVEAGLVHEAGAQLHVMAQGTLHLVTPVFVELTRQIGFEVFGVHAFRPVPAGHRGRH